MEPQRIVVDLAVFAHQEEKTIANAITDLARSPSNSEDVGYQYPAARPQAIRI